METWIFYFILYIPLSQTSNTLFAQTNGNITLKTSKQQIQEILWKFEGDKVVDWDIHTDNIIEYLQFKGRTFLDRKTGDVTISGLKPTDSGQYEAEVDVDNGIHSVKYNVEVIDPVSKPSIACINSTLSCQAEGPRLSYSWRGPGLTTEINGQDGPNISREEAMNLVFECVVKNPVSENSQHFQAAQCFKDEGGGNILIIVVVILSVLVVLLAIASVVYVYKRNRKGDRHFIAVPVNTQNK